MLNPPNITSSFLSSKNSRRNFNANKVDFFVEIQIGHNVFDGNPNTQMMWGMQPPLPTCSSDMWNKNHLVTECVEQGMNQLLCDEHLSQQQYKLNV